MTARHHHYLSQCYLKGFSKGRSKKSKLKVFDLAQLKEFETIPRNIGGIRDFNRIDAEGVEPDALENAFAEFEGEAAKALRELADGKPFERETKTIILNLIALFAARSPERRAHFAKFETQVMERVMDLTLATKEQWESQIKRMRKDGYNIADSPTYEEVKQFHDSKEYTIEFAREHHIRLELTVLDSILDCLGGRKWMLIQANEETGYFVSSDNPVYLTWKEPEKIPLFYRQSPGFGLKGTLVFFPVTKDLALIGEFEGQEGIYPGCIELVASINSGLILNSNKQVYAPSNRFFFLGAGGHLLPGNKILKVASA